MPSPPRPVTPVRPRRTPKTPARRAAAAPLLSTAPPRASANAGKVMKLKRVRTTAERRSDTTVTASLVGRVRKTRAQSAPAQEVQEVVAQSVQAQSPNTISRSLTQCRILLSLTSACASVSSFGRP
jgi:SLT domain-containing protein